MQYFLQYQSKDNCYGSLIFICEQAEVHCVHAEVHNVIQLVHCVLLHVHNLTIQICLSTCLSKLFKKAAKVPML